MGRLLTCVPGPVPDQRADTIWIGRPSTVPMIVEVRWLSLLPSSMLSSGDFPTVAAQRIHQLDRPLDELGRLVDLFHRLTAVRARDDHAVTTAAVSQNLVT